MTYRQSKASSDDPLGDGALRCRRCDTKVISEQASSLGGLCSYCYRAYCNEPQRRPDVGDKGKHPLSWAFALQRRHAAGERLTQGQINCYREALPAWRQSEE